MERGLVSVPIRPAGGGEKRLLPISRGFDAFATDLTDDREAVNLLRLASPIAFLFLLAYLVIEPRLRAASPATPSIWQWAMLAATCLLFGATGFKWFQRQWRLLVLFYVVFIMAACIGTSAISRDPESRFIAILLCPVGTACFVRWGPRWQMLANGAAIGAFAFAQRAVPIPSSLDAYRWLALVAAVTFAQLTAFALNRYRERVHEQFEALENDARFREQQAALMAHEIRNPLASIAGLAGLLRDDDLGEQEGREVIDRIGAAIRNVDLLIANLMDLYAIDQGRLTASNTRARPDAIVEAAAAAFSSRLERERLRLNVELGSLPPANLDSAHFERVVGNLLNYAASRTRAGEIGVRTKFADGRFALEVSDSGPALTQEEMAQLFDPPATAGRRLWSSQLALYVTRALVGANHGTIRAQAGLQGGLIVRVELPLESGAG